jgi:hypothetical protein
MNGLSPELETGTLGELLVQLKLLQYGVQAAPPLKDSGNDLIAVRGETFKAIQVKTSRADRIHAGTPNRSYHLLAIVRLVGEERELALSDCEVFLIPTEAIAGLSTQGDFEAFRMCGALVDGLFPPPRR